MADIRIKDLATLESASLTGDVFVIDGTTGTRKLSAFSPSFGGNATVTGTLTVNGGTVTLTGAAYPTFYADGSSGGGFTIRKAGVQYGLLYGNETDTALDSGSSTNLVLLTGGATRATINSTRVSIPLTTASTTTSTGALVVGNGTSGGLGVGGAGNFGGAVGVGGATVASRLHVYESTSGTGDSNGITIEQASTADAALQFLLTGVQRWTVGIDNSDSDKFKIGTGAIGAADRLTIDTSGNLSIPATTASTSTSIGALVVSGGVGVAKRIHSGEGLTTGGDNETHISFVRNGTVSIGPDSTGTPALVVSSAIKTSAPSGGTAANWKLGTVASVSPTSPNRTIEVDIGGTIYYIHAKTTNN